MNKHTTITTKIAAFSLAAVSCASLMLAPMNGIAAPLQNFCITASASSDNYKKDTVVLDNNRSVTLSAGKQRHWFSQNGKYQLTLTAYGNLVLKETNSGNTIWSTGLGNDYSSNRSFKLVMQTDGNLVLYDKNSKAKWDSRTLIKGGGNSYSLRLSNDGELYVYHYESGHSLWSSRSEIECTAKSNTLLRPSQCLTSKNRLYCAMMQQDGNFVIYRRNYGTDSVVWHTNTYNHKGAFLALQQDGNLVVYQSGRALYNSGTCYSPHAAYKLSLGDDGILRLVRKSDMREIWNASKGINKIEKMLDWAVKIAADDTHGYSQTNRLGPNYDCSSFVSSAAKQAGFRVSADLNTRTMKEAFKAAGFEWIKWSDIGGPANLKRGDILLNEASHTVLYLGNNRCVAARGVKDRTKAEQISEHDYYNGNWDGVLRYNG